MILDNLCELTPSTRVLKTGARSWVPSAASEMQDTCGRTAEASGSCSALPLPARMAEGTESCSRRTGLCQQLSERGCHSPGAAAKKATLPAPWLCLRDTGQLPASRPQGHTSVWLLSLQVSERFSGSDSKLLQYVNVIFLIQFPLFWIITIQTIGVIT